MTLHVVRIGALVMLPVFVTFYPFLPGVYDAVAVPLSAMAQAFGAVGLLFVPVGLAWLIYELRKRRRRNGNLPAKPRGFYFALASVVVSLIVAIAISLGAFVSGSFSLVFLTLALWVYVAWRLRPGLQFLKKAEGASFNPAPLYLILVPAIVFVLQLTFAPHATRYSRNRAIAESAELIQAIEKYRAAHGSYPAFLQAVNKDYHPSVVGIDQFHYAPNGDAYNLFFEQPTFLMDFGLREIVMYNKRDEHVMASHVAWILEGAPESLSVRQGWNAAHAASTPHWKYFWFD